MYNIEPIITVVVAAVAAVWVVWQTLLKREVDPTAELSIDLQFVARQDDKWIVEVIATM